MAKSKKSKNGSTIKAMGSNAPGKGQPVDMVIMDEAAEMPTPKSEPIAAKTPGEVLIELQDQLAEGNLPEEQVDALLRDPVGFLYGRIGDWEKAKEVMQTIAKLYFATLHKRAVDGEAFTEARLKQALIEARTRILEAIANGANTMAHAHLLSFAELVSKD